MNRKPLLAAGALSLVSLGGLIAPSTTLAASQNECAIWICLPGGFPSGCGAAHSAMVDRIKHRKSPLPSFGSCAVQGNGGSGSKMSYDYSFAALIAARRVCTQRDWRRGDYDSCVAWETVPQHYVKGTNCRYEGDYRVPYGCIRTYRYIDVFVDGVMAGDTYFW